MNFLDRSTANKFLTLLFLTAVLGVLYCARSVVLLFIIAILVAYLLDPIVQFLQRHSLFFRDLRGPAVMKTYFVFLLLIAVVIYGATPRLTKAPDKLVQNVSGFLDSLSSGEIAEGISGKAGWSADQAVRLKAFLAGHRAAIDKMVEEVEQVIPSVMEGFLLVPILAIFFLRDGRRIANGCIRWAARWGKYDDLKALAGELDVTLRQYIRTKVILSGLSLAFYCAALFALRIPHALALAILGAALEFLPVAGWIAAAATILSVALLSQSHWIWMAALLGLWRLTQDYINGPRVMGRHLEIHPLLSIFGMMVGWEVGGIMGVYFSVPLMAVLGVIWRRSFSANSQTAKQTEKNMMIAPSVPQAAAASDS